MPTRIRSTIPFFACSVLGVAASVITGCGANPIVGKWSGDVPGPAGKQIALTVEFKSDGTAVQTMEAGSQTFQVYSTYTTKDGTISETSTSATMNGKPMEHAAIGKTQSLSYKIDGNSLSIAQQGVPIETLTRSVQ